MPLGLTVPAPVCAARHVLGSLLMALCLGSCVVESSPATDDRSREIEEVAERPAPPTDMPSPDARVPDALMDAGMDVTRRGPNVPPAMMDAAPSSDVIDAGPRGSNPVGADAAPVNTSCTDPGSEVIWALDTSGSTLFALPQLATNLQLHLSQTRNRSDIRVVLLGSGSYGGDAGLPAADAGGPLQVVTAVESKRLLAALLDNFPAYAAQLRPGATTHIVAVSDDDDAMMPSEFKKRMEQLLGHAFVFHAVASPAADGGMPCVDERAATQNPICVSPIPSLCAASAVGARYYQLATETGGERISICKQDWGPLLARLRQFEGPPRCP